jgi:hypothetical protein
LEKNDLKLAMLREISTYGALLLTALVVYRASSLDAETTKIERLYQRDADQQFSASNLALRSQISAEITYTRETKLLASTASAKKSVITFVTSALTIDRNVTEVSYNPPVEEFMFSDVSVSEEDLSLSLDRENTISRSLSIHAPRQRIQPKPSVD